MCKLYHVTRCLCQQLALGSTKTQTGHAAIYGLIHVVENVVEY